MSGSRAQITLAHGTTYLASRPKDNASYVGLQEAIRDARQHGNLGVPLHLRNAVTSLMKEIRYGQGYRYVHNDPKAKSEQGHLPEPLKGKRYYRPGRPKIMKKGLDKAGFIRLYLAPRSLWRVRPIQPESVSERRKYVRATLVGSALVSPTERGQRDLRRF